MMETSNYTEVEMATTIWTEDVPDDSFVRQYKLNYTQRCILAAVYVFVCLSTAFGNSLVILSVLFSRKVRTFTNVFVVNLSVSDLFVCCALVVNIVALLGMDGFPLPETVCVISSFIGFTAAGCSIYNLAVIAFSRWAAITRSVAVQKSWFEKKKLVAMVMVTWTIPALVAFVPPQLGLGELGYAEKYSTCSHKTSHELSDYYSLLQGAVFYPVPLLIIIICYWKIFVFVRAHTRHMVEEAELSSYATTIEPSSPSPQGQHTNGNMTRQERLNRRQVEITKNLFYVVLAFLICVTPIGVSLMIPPSDPVIPWASALLLFNSCVNPVIYATKHPNFKKIFRKILTCRWDEIPEPSNFLKALICKRISM